MKRYSQSPKEFRQKLFRWLFDGSYGGGELKEACIKYLKDHDIHPKKRVLRLLTSREFRGVTVVVIVIGIGLAIKSQPNQSFVETIFDNLESIALGSAGIIFLLEIQDRRKRDQYEAWQVLNSALGKPGNGGRTQALEDLIDSGVDLEGVAAPNADLSGVDLSFGKLERANFRRAQLNGSTLESSKLGFADLRGADLTGANLRGALLLRAQLQNAKLRNANLQGAFLSYADLEGADLRNAKLQRAKLVGAILKDADFTGAELEGAFLGSADLQGAIFMDTDLTQADTREARNLPDNVTENLHNGSEVKSKHV